MADDAFLDVIGAGGAPVRPLPPGRAGGRPSVSPSAVQALAPVAAMLAVLAVVALFGLSRSGVAEAFEPYVYGFFLDRYPLFAFALLYGGARIVAASLWPGPGHPARRLVVAGAGLAVLGLAGLYPTFGGLALRGGFAVGGMAYLTGQPLWLAYGLGAGIAATMIGGIVGATVLAANRSLRPSLRRIGRGAIAFACVWFAAAVLGLAHGLGFGPWPARAMLPREALLAAGLLLAAMAPHAALVALTTRRDGG